MTEALGADRYVDHMASALDRQQALQQGPGPVLQTWVWRLSMMQQSVLLTAVRGPDALPKYHPSKYLLRWYRRCILLSAMDRRVLEDPVEPNGGSFTGPSVHSVVAGVNFDQSEFAAIGVHRDPSTWAVPGHFSYGQPVPTSRPTWQEAMDDWVTAYIASLDEVPHHYQLHFMHAAEVVGYKHPTPEIRGWWLEVYIRLVRDMHLDIETEERLDDRLGDSREQWLRYGDEATEA